MLRRETFICIRSFECVESLFKKKRRPKNTFRTSTRQLVFSSMTKVDRLPYRASRPIYIHTSRKRYITPGISFSYYLSECVESLFKNKKSETEYSGIRTVAIKLLFAFNSIAEKFSPQTAVPASAHKLRDYPEAPPSPTNLYTQLVAHIGHNRTQRNR